MIHGLLLYFGEKKFGDPSKGILYSYLRANPLQPTCVLRKSSQSVDNINELNQLDPCEQKYAFYRIITKATTAKVKAYRQFEIDFFNKSIN